LKLIGVIHKIRRGRKIRNAINKNAKATAIDAIDLYGFGI
jgi:hypothetical protein